MVGRFLVCATVTCLTGTEETLLVFEIYEVEGGYLLETCTLSR